MNLSGIISEGIQSITLKKFRRIPRESDAVFVGLCHTTTLFR